MVITVCFFQHLSTQQWKTTCVVSSWWSWSWWHFIVDAGDLWKQRAFGTLAVNGRLYGQTNVNNQKWPSVNLSLLMASGDMRLTGICWNSFCNPHLSSIAILRPDCRIAQQSMDGLPSMPISSHWWSPWHFVDDVQLQFHVVLKYLIIIYLYVIFNPWTMEACIFVLKTFY